MSHADDLHALADRVEQDRVRAADKAEGVRATALCKEVGDVIGDDQIKLR